METQLRTSGIELIGFVPWGTHFCQFYKTTEDLLDILVPYFKAGLMNNEFCMWITAKPLEDDAAKTAMREAIPDFDDYVDRGQIEIMPYSDWYIVDGNFDSERVLQGWIDKLGKALERGYDGLRLTGNTFWLEKDSWNAFTDYELEVENVIHDYKMIAICSYSLDKCNVNEILDVMSAHQFALIAKDDQWKIVESFDFKRARSSLNKTIGTLQDLNSRFQCLLNNAIEGISRTTLEGKILSVNPAFAKIFGYDSPDEVSNTISDIRDLYVDPDQREEFAKKMQLDGIVKGFENPIRRKDGSKAWVLVNSRPLVNTDGEMIGYESFYNDITALKETTEALQNSEERLQLAQANGNIGVWDWNTIINELSFSPELERLYGLEPGTINTYEDWRCRVLPDDIDRVESERDESVSTHTQFNIEFRILHGSNQIRWINAKGRASYDNADEVCRITGINIDITERKHLEEELLVARDKLEARVKARTIDLEIANNLLHDEIKERERIEKELRESQEVLRQNAARNQALADISNILAEVGLDYQELLDTIVWKAVQIMGDVCSIRLISEDGQKLPIVAYYHVDPEAAALLGQTISSYTNTIDEGIPGKVIQTRQSILVTDINEDDYPLVTTPGFEKYGEKFGHSSILAVPLIAHGNIIGVLVMGRMRNRPSYSENDKVFMQNLADRIALAIEFARLFQQNVESLEKIREQANLLEKAHDAIVVRDLNQNITYWNNGAVELYGWTTEEAIGRPARLPWYKDVPSVYQEAEEMVLSKGEWTGEIDQITKYGKRIIVESRWTLIFDSNGKPTSILTINTDITEKKGLEKQLLRAQRLESVNTLAGGIAHDLNNLLTPMLLSAQLLKEECSSEQGMELVSILENNAQRSADLIKRIMSFERGTEGERKPLKIADIIKEVETIINETFPRSIETHFDVPRDSGMIIGDSNQLHQVLMNLCTNARDAMPEGGLLTISVENMVLEKTDPKTNGQAKPGPYMRISVTDTGSGIAPEIQEHLFEPFFTTKETGKGSGLGLPIALSIVKGHGGFIDVFTEEGRGTIFNVFLPMIEAEASHVEKREKSLHFGNGESILIVDDEASILMIAHTILETHGYKVLEAGSGADAIELYRLNRYSIDVCLVDIMMPIMNGIEVIKLIRTMNPEAKIIAMSGMVEKDMQEEIKISNVQGLLKKPFSAENLLNTLHQFFLEQENQ